MYLKTPKRYTSRGKRRMRLFGRRWWLYILTPIMVVASVFVWEFRQPISATFWEGVGSLAQGVGDEIATNQAPTATPTESPEIYLVAAASAYSQGVMEEAIRNYTLAAEGMPNDVAVHYTLAHLLITNGRSNEALGTEDESGDLADLGVVDRAINADPYDSRGWAIQGMAYNWAGENEQAIASLLRALELDPNNAPAHAFLAETYWDMNLVDPAFEQIDVAITLDPNDFNVQRSYGYIFQILEPAAATEAFERAMQLAPMHAYIAEGFATHLFRQGDIEGGIALLEQVVERNPQNAAAHYQLASALYNQLGQVEQARAEFERCTVIAPDYIPCLTFLGALQASVGEFNLCARSYRQALDLGTENPDHYYTAGICYGAIGECGTAVEIWFAGLAFAEDVEDQEAIRDALAGCQVVITLEPTTTPIFTPTPELDLNATLEADES